MEVQMVGYKGADEEIAVVVAFLHARRQLHLPLNCLLENPGVQLNLQELIIGACRQPHPIF